MPVTDVLTRPPERLVHMLLRAFPRSVVRRCRSCREVSAAGWSHNARILTDRTGARGVSVCGVTKATLGAPEVARALLAAGVGSLGESRIENVERLRGAGIVAEVLLVAVR